MSTPEQKSIDAVPTMRSLLSLAWPIVIARSAQVVVGFSDAVMVGSLGESALAATMTGGLNAFLLFILPMGTVFIVSSYTSQLYGQRRLRAARRFGFYGLGIALAAAFTFFGLTFFVDSAVSVLNYAPEVQELSAAYIAIRLLSGGPAVGLEALGNFYAGLGNTRLPMLAQLVAMSMNVALNAILIFGMLGFPALGVVGAAWASVIATSVAFCGLLLCFLFKLGLPQLLPPRGVETGENQAAKTTPEEALLFNASEEAALSLREALGMLKVGLPVGLNWFLEFAAYGFFINVVIAGLGTTTLAAMNAVIEVNSIAFMPAFGIASAGAILVGQQLGKKRIDFATRAVHLTLFATMIWQSTMAVLYLLMPRLLMSVFVRDDATAFIDLGSRMLMLSAAWQLFDAAATTLGEALRAAGDTTFSMWARICIAWFVFVPGSYFTVVKGDGGEIAAVLWLVTYLGLLAAVMVFRFQSGRWKSMTIV